MISVLRGWTTQHWTPTQLLSRPTPLLRGVEASIQMRLIVTGTPTPAWSESVGCVGRKQQRAHQKRRIVDNKTSIYGNKHLGRNRRSTRIDCWSAKKTAGQIGFSKALSTGFIQRGECWKETDDWRGQRRVAADDELIRRALRLQTDCATSLTSWRRRTQYEVDSTRVQNCLLRHHNISCTVMHAHTCDRVVGSTCASKALTPPTQLFLSRTKKYQTRNSRSLLALQRWLALRISTAIFAFENKKKKPKSTQRPAATWPTGGVCRMTHPLSTNHRPLCILYDEVYSSCNFGVTCRRNPKKIRCTCDVVRSSQPKHSMSSSKSSSMARRRFRKDECEWLALHSLQLGSRGHSEDAWRELHTGFCTRFGREDAGRMPTLEQLRKKVRHLEAQRQTSVVARAKAHIQAHAIKQEEERALAESEARRALLGTATDTDGNQRRKRRRGHAYEDARIKEEATTGNTEPARVEAVRSAETPAVESRGLLRTRPLSSLGADMLAGSANVKRVFGVRRRRFGTGAGTGSEEAIDLRDSDQERVVMQVPLVATPTTRSRVESDVTSTPLRVTESSASESSSTIGSATVLPRRPSSSSAHIDTEALLTEKLKVAERQRDEAQRDAQMWKNRFESEKTLSDMLQKRLKSALSELAEKERQLQRLEGSSRSSSNTVASPSTSSAVTFTINLQMDVTQNGERMRTVNHTLRLDGSDSSRAA